MGKRPRTPHFLPGIGDGNVHDGGNKEDNRGETSRLRGNQGSNTDDENDAKSNVMEPNHRPQNHYNRKDFPHRIDESDRMGDFDSGDAWDTFQRTGIPVMDLNLDLDKINGGIDIHSHVVGSTRPWQVSAFAFLGVLVVFAIVLHFVAENSLGANNHKKNKEISKTSSSKHRNSGSYSRPSQYRRRQRQRRMQKLRKKKTDEWSDDEEPIQNGAGVLSMGNSLYSSLDTGRAGNSSFDDGSSDQVYPYEYDYDYNEYDTNEYDNQNRSVYQQSNYYREPNSYLSGQDISHRRTGATRDSHDYYTTQRQPPAIGKSSNAAGVVPTYKSPSASEYLMESSSYRNVNSMNSYNSSGSSPRQRQGKRPNRNYSSADSVSSPIWEVDQKDSNHSQNRGSTMGTPKASRSSNQAPAFAVGSALSWQHEMNDTRAFPEDLQQPTLETPIKSNQANRFDDGVAANRPEELGARSLDAGSRFSSFASFTDVELEKKKDSSNFVEENNVDAASGGEYGGIDRFDNSSQSSHVSLSPGRNNIGSPAVSMYEQSFASSVQSQFQQDMHQKSLLLTPGNFEETPLIGNARKTISFNEGGDASLNEAALLPISGSDHNVGTIPNIPYVPQLHNGEDSDTAHSPAAFGTDPPPPPPRSIIMDELRLVEMETGSSTAWNSDASHHEDLTSFADEGDIDQVEPSATEQESSEQGSNSYEGSDISIPSGDPRKNIIHKRRNLTASTDASTSLQSSIDFAELQLQEVIGGGGFGQVWKATWRGTPVAVKVLTGSAQNTHIAKAILEEFKAEINLLKGMRHPNICLYMGACLTPPNRAIVTELAAHGSAWDSLRLPLSPPYTTADGTPRGCWPLRLYLPGQHGIPPSSHGSSAISAPIPPRGTWPWELVKRVSCGAARGMAYLHSGNPPVLHRDLKSANLLLDDSYTTKVCDFGLSRLKAQSRSMTANCGTVQWMAPEVLANRSYDEKADVYSFGIIVWELLSRECPYEGMTAIQCALAVLNRDKRPEIPKWCPPGLHALIKSCIKKDPCDRPTFTKIIVALDALG